VPIRAELAAASARLGPERATETLLGAQKRLGTAEKHTKKRLYSPLTPATDVHQVGQPLAMGWRGGWVAVAQRCGQ
jgi:hypothetical protein